MKVLFCFVLAFNLIGLTSAIEEVPSQSPTAPSSRFTLRHDFAHVQKARLIPQPPTPRGVTGATGATGAGRTGPTGIIGPTGPSDGATGATGQPGESGTPGIPGTPGEAGTPGEPGSPGIPGEPGSPGINGNGTSADCVVERTDLVACLSAVNQTCDTNYFATGGGIMCSSNQARVIQNEPIVNGDEQSIGWTGRCSVGTCIVSAVCCP